MWSITENSVLLAIDIAVISIFKKFRYINIFLEWVRAIANKENKSTIINSRLINHKRVYWVAFDPLKDQVNLVLFYKAVSYMISSHENKKALSPFYHKEYF